MIASLVQIAICTFWFAQQSVANPVGVWVAHLGPKPSFATEAIWGDGKLRLRKDGTFKIYAPIAAEGRYTNSGKQLHLVLSKVLGKDVAFWNGKLAEQPILSGMRFDMPLDIEVTPSTLTNSSTYPEYAGVKWTPVPPVPILSLLKRLSKSEDYSDPATEFAYDEIVERGAGDIPELTQVLDGPSNDLDLRYWAACMMGDTHAQEAVLPLIQALDTYKPPTNGKSTRLVPMGIVNSLGKLKSKQAVPSILRYGATRKVADYSVTRALGEIGDPGAVDFLVGQLSRPNLGKSDGLMRGLTIKSLGEIGDPRALPAVLKFQTSKQPEVIAALSAALPRLEKDASHQSQYVPALIEALPKSEWLAQCDIVEALGNSGDPRAIVPLLGALTNKEGTVVRYSIQALGKLKAKQAIPALTKFLTNPENGLRDAATEALKEIKS